MSLKWSFSTDKRFRRCQRQFYFAEIAAHHSMKDEWRREAFVLKQLRSIEAWRGTIIHEGIEKLVVPELKFGRHPDWEKVAEQSINRAEAQLNFSAMRRFREPGIKKGEHDDFCALLPHETGQGISEEEFGEVRGAITKAFERLSDLTHLWEKILGKSKCRAEMPLWVNFEDVRIMVQIDLFFLRSRGRPTIIDWKSFEVGGDSDADLQTALYGWAVQNSGSYGVARPEDIELIECQVQDGVVIEHECTQDVFDELEDRIYQSIHRIKSLCSSKKLSESDLSAFAYADNPNNCEHCAFRDLCVKMAVPTAPITTVLEEEEKSGAQLSFF